MDILVRKYVEKKANKWGFSDDIDISKEIIKVENTYSDKIFKVRFNSRNSSGLCSGANPFPIQPFDKTFQMI